MVANEEDAAQIEDALRNLYGISGWAKALLTAKEIPEVLGACVETARNIYARGIRTFKLEARRTDKSFPLDSYGICAQGGGAILAELPDMQVDVHKPQAVIQVEIREQAYIYSLEEKGLRGLPVGSAGRGLLLLSGGIDSPVAGNMMLSRGMAVDGVYFHAYPYTSEEARQKVIRLAEILGKRSVGTRLFTVNFTPIQLRIKERAPEAWMTVLLRMAMMACGERIALRRRMKCLITGESLSQVASQTIENIACVSAGVSLPIMRPLIGMEKEEIIRRSRSMGAYDISILPYEDCCVLFSPPHPILRGDPMEARSRYEKLELDELLQEALQSMVTEKCSFPDKSASPASGGAQSN